MCYKCGGIGHTAPDCSTTKDNQPSRLVLSQIQFPAAVAFSWPKNFLTFVPKDKAIRAVIASATTADEVDEAAEHEQELEQEEEQEEEQADDEVVGDSEEYSDDDAGVSKTVRSLVQSDISDVAREGGRSFGWFFGRMGGAPPTKSR